MNKQEVIEKLHEAGLNSDQMKYAEKYDKGYKNGIAYALNLVSKLDEPEKPVLTKEEAEWFEELKESKSYLNKYDLLYFISRQGFGYSFSFKTHDKEVVLKGDDSDYINDEEVKKRLINAILYGYVVKKEKLYTVELPNPHDNFHTILYKNPNGNISIEYDYDDDWATGNCYQLTEEEINEDFEWAFQFAKEVEE